MIVNTLPYYGTHTLPRTGGEEKDMYSNESIKKHDAPRPRRLTPAELLQKVNKDLVSAYEKRYTADAVSSKGRFKPETIRRVMTMAGAAVLKYAAMAADSIKLCISRGNRKIGRVMNVSLMPGIACGNCAACIGYCYDIKACAQYSNTVIDARVRNYMLAMYHRAEFFARIDAACSRRRTNKFFRWHVAGDILDADYFAHMVEIAEKHPDFIFWTYTKMYGIVNTWIRDHGPLPSNLHIMFSVWDGMPCPNPYNMPVYVCRLKDGNKDMTDAEIYSLYHCPGNCDICKAAGRGCVSGESAYIDEH